MPLRCVHVCTYVHVQGAVVYVDMLQLVPLAAKTVITLASGSHARRQVVCLDTHILLPSRHASVSMTFIAMCREGSHIYVTLSLLSSRWHHIYVNLSLLSSRWHHIDVTLSLLSSRWHHIVTRWRHMTWHNFSHLFMLSSYLDCDCFLCSGSTGLLSLPLLTICSLPLSSYMAL